MRRVWDDWDSNGTVTRWIGTVMHGSVNVTQVVEWVGNIVQRVLVNFSALEEAWKEWRNAPEALKYEAWKLHIREQDYVQDVKELTEEKQGLLDKLIDPNDVRIKDLEAEVAKVDLELTFCKIYIANHGGNQEEEDFVGCCRGSH